MILPPDEPQGPVGSGSTPPEDEDLFADLTPEQTSFLVSLDQGVSAKKAAALAGISLATLFRHRRAGGPFSEAWTAVEESIDLEIESTAVWLATHGSPKPMLYKGEPIIDPATGERLETREYPASLIVFLLKTRPTLRARYGDQVGEDLGRNLADRFRELLSGIDASIPARPPEE